METNLSKDQREKIIQLMIDNRDFRISLIKDSLYWFSHYYFPNHTKIETAEFQKEIFQILQSEKNEMFVLAAARGLGKSTIATFFYPIWAVLTGRKRFPIIISKTQRQADHFLGNIRDEFEQNKRLIADRGPFSKETDPWGRPGLVLGHYNAKLMAASTEQGIRGMTYRDRRPDLFVVDDIEDAASVKSRDGRENLFAEWFQKDLIPAGNPDTRIVVVGGILHRDSFLVKLRKLILEDKIDGIYREYAILNAEGKSMWTGLYPDMKSIEDLKRKSMTEIAWQQEYCLKIISSDDQIVRQEWLEGQMYDEIPANEKLIATSISVDPAVSKGENRDYTAIIVVSEYAVGDERKIYVHPNPVNAKLSFHEIQQQIRNLNHAYRQKGGPVRVFIESVAAQEYLVQEMAREGIYVKGCKVRGKKEERLMMAAAPIEAKLVYFPKKGCELLITQLLGFGVEPHDDLADAFSQAINEIMMMPYVAHPQVIGLL